MMPATSCHPEDAAALWIIIGGKCPLIIIDFECVDVATCTYDNYSTDNNSNDN